MKVYLEALGDLGEANPAFAGAIKMIKNGLQAKLADQESKESLNSTQNDLKQKAGDPKQTPENLTEEDANQKVKTLERVIKEIKKQLASYKQEITSIKKMESYITMENY